MLGIFIMPVWKTLPVSEQPKIFLSNWFFFKCLNGEPTWHLGGYNKGNWEGRISSKIVKIDAEHNTVTTNSGRIYAIVGESGANQDALYVFGKWLVLNDIKDFEVYTQSISEIKELFDREQD
jgi:hypothetical protein